LGEAALKVRVRNTKERSRMTERKFLLFQEPLNFGWQSQDPEIVRNKCSIAPDALRDFFLGQS
jgi:hypothetical protein